MSTPTPYRFDGKVAVVTGGGQGIGLAIAEELASGGATIVVADVQRDVAAQAAEHLRSLGAQAEPFAIDVTDADACVDLMAFADGLADGLGVVVNNAAISRTEIIEETAPEQWRSVVDVNLNGPFMVCLAAIPVLRARGGGTIVNVASVAAKRISYNAGASYTASKAGLLALTRHLAYEVARDGIRVNAICPGPVLSPMLERTATPETIAARSSVIPLGRLSTPADQARAVAYLASDASDMVTGVALDVDGGALLGWYDTETYFARRTGAPTTDA